MLDRPGSPLDLPRLPLLHPLLLCLHHIHPLIRIRQPPLLLNRTRHLPILPLTPRSLHIRALERQTRNHNRHRQSLRIHPSLHQFLRSVHWTPAHHRKRRAHARQPRRAHNGIPVIARPAQRALFLAGGGIEGFELRGARAVVVVVGVLGGFVGAAAAVGADDCCEAAGGYGEKDFEGEGQVADEGVAVLGGVDAGGADGEADYAGEGAAFYCCAGGRC
jgi:hypothetical protein